MNARWYTAITLLSLGGVVPAVLAEELIRQGKDFDFAFAPGATHSWSREPHYERYLFGKMIEYFDRYLLERAP